MFPGNGQIQCIIAAIQQSKGQIVRMHIAAAAIRQNGNAGACFHCLQQIFIQIKLFCDTRMETDLCTQLHDALVHVSGMLRMKNEEWFRGEFVIIQNHFL